MVGAKTETSEALDPADADMRSRILGLMEQRAVSPLLEATLEYLRDYPDSGWGWLISAPTLIDLGRYDDAQAALANARQLSPAAARPGISYWRCILHKERGDLKKARQHIEKAIKLDPANGAFWVTLGDVLARRGDLKAAVKALKQAIQLGESASADATQSDLEEAFFSLALVRRSQRRYRDALAQVEQALEIDPDYAEAHALKNDLEAVLQGGW